MHAFAFVLLLQAFVEYYKTHWALSTVLRCDFKTTSLDPHGFSDPCACSVILKQD